eukprot:scaffold63273_cov25-Attheya_sp.AAC.1
MNNGVNATAAFPVLQLNMKNPFALPKMPMMLPATVIWLVRSLFPGFEGDSQRHCTHTYVSKRSDGNDHCVPVDHEARSSFDSYLECQCKV